MGSGAEQVTSGRKWAQPDNQKIYIIYFLKTR